MLLPGHVGDIPSGEVQVVLRLPTALAPIKCYAAAGKQAGDCRQKAKKSRK